VDRSGIYEHWQGLARQHGQNLSATTHTATIKRLELDALCRTLESVAIRDLPNPRLLEVGCGNGINCAALAEWLPSATIVGVDFSAEMTKHALVVARDHGVSERVRFVVGDVLEMKDNSDVGEDFDVVFSARCVINLPDDELQMAAIDQMIGKLRAAGHLVMMENVRQPYDRQNRCRVALGLPPRTPAAYNHFLDEDLLLRHTRARGLTLVASEDFAGLHDLLLYVLLPAATDGEVDYGHVLVDRVTELLVRAGDDLNRSAGVGQNRLYLFARSPTTASQAGAST